jgi:hypothetical protein
MLFPATSTSCASSGIASIGSGGTFWFAAVKPRGRSGRSLLRSSKGGYHHPASCTHILNHAFTPLILHKNRMRRRARTGLSGGRSVMSVPTGSGTAPTARHTFRQARFPALFDFRVVGIASGISTV